MQKPWRRLGNTISSAITIRIGRYAPDEAYARGIADLDVLAGLLPNSGFLFGAKPGSVDAGIYGFIANIYFYEIDTPLKESLLSKKNLVAHCKSIHTVLQARAV